MPTDWPSWRSQTRSTGLVRSTTANRISTSFAEPARSCAPHFCGRMSLPQRSCVNIWRELTMIVSGASSRQQLRPTNRKCLRSTSLLNATAACGEGFPRGGANRFNARLLRRFLCGLRAAGGSTIEKVLFTPFRAGTAHIMIFRPVSPGWTVPRWAQKGQRGADGAAQEGNDNGCGERISRHVMPQS